MIKVTDTIYAESDSRSVRTQGKSSEFRFFERTESIEKRRVCQNIGIQNSLAKKIMELQTNLDENVQSNTIQETRLSDHTQVQQNITITQDQNGLVSEMNCDTLAKKIEECRQKLEQAKKIAKQYSQLIFTRQSQLRQLSAQNRNLFQSIQSKKNKQRNVLLKIVSSVRKVYSLKK